LGQIQFIPIYRVKFWSESCEQKGLWLQIQVLKPSLTPSLIFISVWPFGRKTYESSLAGHCPHHSNKWANALVPPTPSLRGGLGRVCGWKDTKVVEKHKQVADTAMKYFKTGICCVLSIDTKNV
jgi:hypothetical protein